MCLFGCQVEEATQSVNQSVTRVNKGSNGSGSGSGPAAMATGMIMKFLGNGAAKLTDR